MISRSIRATATTIADLPQRPFDLDKAKFHFQKSGVGGRSLPITVSPAADNSIEMAELMQQAGAKIGLNLDREARAR